MIIKNENSKNNGAFYFRFSNDADLILYKKQQFCNLKKFGVTNNFDHYLTTYPPQIEIVCPFTYFASWKL